MISLTNDFTTLVIHRQLDCSTLDPQPSLNKPVLQILASLRHFTVKLVPSLEKNTETDQETSGSLTVLTDYHYHSYPYGTIQ
ncbi:hypothetical protein SHDE107825_13140 [Shewanella denitrificans]|jgi:hypothetical protein